MESNDELMYDFEIDNEPDNSLHSIEDSRIGRHVQWLNTKSKSYNVFEKACLGVSIIGLPLLHKINKTTNKIKRYNKFRNDVLGVPPPTNIKIMVKESTRTFNHVADYIIHNGIIWYRRRNCIDEYWKPVYFDGHPKRAPLELYVDGENLMVLVKVGEEYYLHYKKVLEEKLQIFTDDAKKHKPSRIRRHMSIKNDEFEFTMNGNFIWIRSLLEDTTPRRWTPLWHEGWPHSTIINISSCDDFLEVWTDDDRMYKINVSREYIDNTLRKYEFPYTYHYHYSATTTNEIDNWSDRWFTFPYFWLYKMNPKKEKRLKVPYGCLLAMSNRGKFNQYYEDELGGQHAAYSAVTGVYIVLNNRIYLADPWLPRQFNKKSFPLIMPDKYIDPPEGVIIKKLAVSASFLVIYCVDEYGNEYLLCIFKDFDNMGINPGLKYTEVSKAIGRKDIKPEVRVLKDNYRDVTPEQSWNEISMDDIRTEDVDFNTLTVLQTGKGNYARTIRIQTKDLSGYYENIIIDNYWTFSVY